MAGYTRRITADDINRLVSAEAVRRVVDEKTMALCYLNPPESSGLTEPGSVWSGSDLRYAGVRSNGTLAIDGTAPPGTWRCLGFGKSDGLGGYAATLFIRVL